MPSPLWICRLMRGKTEALYRHWTHRNGQRSNGCISCERCRIRFPRRGSIRNRYQPAFPALDRFLTSQGRRKYVAPLYADLSKTDWGRAMAVQIYKRARPTYHSVAVNTIDQTLK